MSSNLLSVCHENVLLCDGAMGTQLIERGMSPGECGMSWNEQRPQDIAAVQKAYATAGCRLLTTNSFGGTRSMLERHGYGDRTADWNRMAAEIAREALGTGGWVCGDVGPFGDFLEPMGDTTEAELLGIFQEQIAALLEGGVDAILVETMSDPGEAALAVRAALSLDAGKPVIATFAFQRGANGEFRTMMGTTVEEALGQAFASGAAIAGANCGTDLSLQAYVELAWELRRAAGDRPVILQPNAGAPRATPDGVVYDATPDEMAAAAVRIAGAGVNIIGGCCGTTPAHLRAMVEALD